MVSQSAEHTALQILDLLRGGDGTIVGGSQSLERTMLDIRDLLEAGPIISTGGAGFLSDAIPQGVDITAGLAGVAELASRDDHDHELGIPMQVIPPPINIATGDDVLVCPVYIDEDTPPNRMVVVVVRSTTQISIISYTLKGAQWAVDDADGDTATLTLNNNSGSQSRINAFAIQSPGDSTETILFISQNDSGAVPDSFQIDSIVIKANPLGAAVACTIAGANAPPNTNSMGVCSIPLTVDRVLTIFHDDGYFGDISGDETGFTFTYADSPKFVIDVDINVNNTVTQEYSGWRKGGQIVLLREATTTANNGAMWELGIDAVKVDEWNPQRIGGMGSYQAQSLDAFSRVTRVGERFAIASPFGGGDPATPPAFMVIPFDVDAL